MTKSMMKIMIIANTLINLKNKNKLKNKLQIKKKNLFLVTKIIIMKVKIIIQ